MGKPIHELLKHLDSYWVKLMNDNKNNDPRIPGVKPNDGKRPPTARELMFEMDVQALADKYEEDGITIVAEDLSGEIVYMWGPALLKDYDDNAEDKP